MDCTHLDLSANAWLGHEHDGATDNEAKAKRRDDLKDIVFVRIVAPSSAPRTARTAAGTSSASTKHRSGHLVSAVIAKPSLPAWVRR